MLYSILDQMVALGVLETRDEPDKQFRWNAAFRGSWTAAKGTGVIDGRDPHQ